MAWNPIANPVDFFILKGSKSPGIGRIEKAGSPRKWDERGGYGASGSVIVFMGRKLATFDGIVELYTEDDWAAWQAFKPLVDRLPFGKRPSALDIWHPYLADLGIKSCVVLDVSQPEPMDLGGHTIRISFQEFRALKISYAKPEASKNDEETDPFEKKIAALTAQYQELAKR